MAKSKKYFIFYFNCTTRIKGKKCLNAKLKIFFFCFCYFQFMLQVYEFFLPFAFGTFFQPFGHESNSKT